MLRSPPTLYERCLQKTTCLVKSSYWNTELPLSKNPFCMLPSSIINTLIVYVSKLFIFEPLLSSHLRFLSASGRVTEFVIEDKYMEEINLDEENLHKILMDLSTSCRYLTTVKINFILGKRRDYPIATPALNFLLSKAQNIKCIVSCLKFDLHVICNSVHLEKLILKFPIKSHIHDFLDNNGRFRVNTCVKHIEVFEVDWFQITHFDSAVILRFCRELVYINVDISKCLEYLHADELHNGTLTPRYKLQKCCLGNETFSKVTAIDGVLIASLTCPYLQEVDLFINDDDVISGLSECKNLRTLSIMWQPMQYGDFMAGVCLLLEKPEIGCNLRSLELVRFTNLDFPSIGKYCPNLEILKVDYIKKYANLNYSPTSFRKLFLIDLAVIRMGSVEADILAGILSNATNLEDLTIVLGGDFTDEVLDSILKKNSLSKLKSFCCYSCNLTIHGMRKLACSATNLRTLELSKRNLNFFQEVVAVFQEINPLVNVSSSSVFVM